MADKLTPEELEKHLQIVQETAAAEEALSEVQERRLINSRAILENALQVAEAKEKLIAQEKAELATLKDQNSEKAKALKQSIKLREEVAKFAKEHRSATLTAIEDTEKLAALAKDNFKSQASSAEADLRKMSAGWQEQQLETWGDLGNMIPKAIGGSLEGLGSMIGGIFDDAGTLAMASLFPGLITGIDALKQKAAAIPGELDTSFRNVIKTTGVNAEKVRDSFVFMLDPLEAERTGKLFRGLSEEAKPLANIGLTADDVGGALGELVKSVALFRPEFIENNKEAAVFTGNLMAGLKKLNVPLATSGKALNMFTKAMKLTPKEATNSLKSITQVADSLGLSVGQVFTNFQDIGPQLVQFGDRTVEVFAELQAQSQATGIEMGKLSGYAEKLDTFKGAAGAAQQLNAVLGSTVLSVTDLVHADPADKFAMIQEAVHAAGVDFESADRRMKQVIATAAGMNVEDFSKLVMNKEEAEAGAEALDTSVMTQEELKKKIEETMTNAELMQKNLSSLGGGFDKFLQRTRTGATTATDALMQGFKGVLQETKNSEAAAIGFVSQLKVASEVLTGAKAAMAPISAGLVAMGSPALAAGGVLGTAKVIDAATRTAPPPGEDGVSESDAIIKQLEQLQRVAAEPVGEGTPTVPIEINVPLLLDSEKVGEASVKGVLDHFKRTFNQIEPV